MKVLILGVDGMIGHKIAQSLISNFHVVGSTRKNINLKKLSLDGLQIFQKDLHQYDNHLSYSPLFALLEIIFFHLCG